MNITYHIGKLSDHIYSNDKRGMIDKHLKAIEHKYIEGEFKIDSSDRYVFNKLISKMRKFNKGTWQKENLEYKILYYSLCYLLNQKTI
ncbi:hypothetical protein [Zobellia galactanivorans]|uniref:Uncharacterized protein n=1 Tax=Zobellia galactanivorans (strain DSM 12802 / CCUG 47099 / CIP 106680 / NCIMB 13871 / Dsij) TaxID=63186 RepID=G0L6X3_ZOBGA|nr:hypothetical protein [Zobellia galactanivorans]CAZ98715.1 Putative protein [Zobellia galactanivorans]